MFISIEKVLTENVSVKKSSYFIGLIRLLTICLVSLFPLFALSLLRSYTSYGTKVVAGKEFSDSGSSVTTYTHKRYLNNKAQCIKIFSVINETEHLDQVQFFMS